MKRILNVLVLTFAINFVLVLAGGAALFKTSHMDREKFAAVKMLLFGTSQPTTMETATATPPAKVGPAERLEKLLEEASGRPAGEQVDFIRRAFDGQSAELDRRQRELLDLQHQIDRAREQDEADRAKIAQAQKDLIAAQEQQDKLKNDQGFQSSLELYNTMPPKQVKQVFLGLSDDTIMQYLQAMEPRTASKIIKEFKTTEETTRIQKVLEKIRLSQRGGATGTALAPGGGAAPGGPQSSLPR